MTEASKWQRPTDSGGSPSSARSTSTGTGSGPGSTPGAAAGPSEAVLGPFTLRELIFGGGVLLLFIGTLLPYVDGLVFYSNFWNSTSLFFIGIGILVPVAALALLAGRRLGAAGLRVGSLSVDQFASVSAVLATTFFFLQTVMVFHIGPFLCLLGAILMLAATVLAPFLPVLKNDLVDRPEVPAHPLARPMTAARPRPRAEKPAVKVAAGSPADSSTVPSTTASSTTASSAVRVPADRRDANPVNPAAAGVRQNGAGLYGAGGAGVIGAGAAASGQSGLRAEPAPVDDDPKEQPQDAASTADHDGRVGGGSSAAQGSSRIPDALETDDATAAEPVVSRTDETRVHEAVPEEYARPDTTRADAGPDRTADRVRKEPITATRTAAEEPVVEAFWFAVGSSRPVYDEQTGHEVFTLEPGDWEVGIEDRGDEFLVQDKRTGAMGVLRDLGNIERAPRD